MRTRTLGQGLTVSAQGLGCMGMSEFYGPGDERGVDRHDPEGARAGDHVPRHRRHVRPVHQRAARRPSHRRTSRRGRAGDQVRQRADAGRDSTSVSTAGPSTCARPATPRSSASASTTSTSTTSTAWTPTRPSRTPLVPWPSWSQPARSATSGSPRRPPTRSAVRTPGPPDHRPPDRMVALDPGPGDQRRARRPCASSGSVSLRTRPLAGGSCPVRSATLEDLAEDDFRRHNPRLRRGEFRQKPALGGPGERRSPGTRGLPRASSLWRGCWPKATTLPQSREPNTPST